MSRALRYAPQGGVRKVAHRTASAADCIGPLSDGVHVTGLTAGQFSSIDALEARLHKRGQDSPQVIARRLLAAGAEMAHAPEFDFVLINEDFERALDQMSAIVTAARLRYPNQAARQRELFAQFGLP